MSGLSETELWLRRALGLLFGQRHVPVPSLNEDEAIAKPT
jgi:hypothetical protein